MSRNFDREKLAIQIICGAIAQCPLNVASASLRWPSDKNASLVINLYLPDRRIEISASPADLNITIPPAIDDIDDLTPFYWNPPENPMERMRQISDSIPFNQNPWLSSQNSTNHNW